MNRTEYMRQLESLLQNISATEREEALQYYNSYCEKVFRIVPTATDNAIWGVEVNILDGTISQILNKNFE